jgi:ribonuclease Z
MSELRITFLGTGSGRPTERRGCAAVHVQLGADGVLFDCGENTQTQVVRAGLRPTRLRLIAISHFHGDHINGLPGFLGSLGLGGHRDPVRIAGPRGLDRYFAVLRELAICRPAFPLELVDAAGPVVLELPTFRVTTAPVDHRVPTWAYRLDETEHAGRFDVAAATALGVTPGPDFGRLQRGEAVTTSDGTVVRPDQVLGPTRRGRSLAYVTDTRPCAAAVELARGVDVLIHEATYLHGLREQAVDRAHSTTVEAARIAEQAGAKKLVLTHISPKHGRRNEILREARSVFPDTELAEDLWSLEIPVPA